MAEYVVEFGKDGRPVEADGRLDAAAFHRNHRPIRTVLQQFLAGKSGDVVEAGSGPTNLLAVFCANVIHIAPWRVAEGLFAGAGRYLGTEGRLFLYGPFKRGGKHTAPSNAAFDQSLRDQNAEWGVRDIDDLEKLAANAGLRLVESVEMPANNLTLVFERRA